MVLFYLKNMDFTFFSFPCYEIQKEQDAICGALFKKYLLVLSLFPLDCLNKILFTTVIGTFNSIGKETRGKFISAPMITETFTTESFPAA
jgi:hypothetical protein